MLLSNDKLDKSNLKYDLMNDEKSYLIPDAKIEHLPPKNRKNQIFSWIVVAVLLLTAALWLMPTYNYNVYFKRNFNTAVLPNTIRTVDEMNSILNNVKQSVALISEKNTETALKYVEAIQEMLQDRTRMATLKINQIVTDKIREIENELTSFDYVVTEASGGIVDYTLQDLKSLRETFSSTTNATYKTDFENVYKTVNEKMTRAFEDLDSMYTFYGSYLGDIIERKVNNATDDISRIINSNRRFCECTIKEKVNFCYTISTQNVKISKQLESVVRVIGILHHTANVLDTLEPNLSRNDKDSCSLFAEARTEMNKALSDAENLLNNILKDDNCFLGSTVRKISNEKHPQQKQLTLNAFESSIQSLLTNLNTTTTNFQVVKKEHLEVFEQDLIKGLTALADEIREKAKELSPTILDEYEIRLGSAASDMQSYMDNKFQNVTNVINEMFEKRQKQIAEGLKYTSEFITFQQLPYISTLSANNYIPTDVCPLTSDYQTFMAITLSQSLAPVEEKTVNQLAESTSFSISDFDEENYNNTSDFVQDKDDQESTDNQQTQVFISQDKESSENGMSNSSKEMLSKVLESIVQDIMSDAVDPSNSQQPVAAVVITDYEVMEDGKDVTK